MRSSSTVKTARILAFAAMFSAVFGVHAFHLLVHSSAHQSDCFPRDRGADNHAESGSDHHHGEASPGQAALESRGETVLSGSCPVCDFFKTRSVQTCSDAVDPHDVYTPPSAPIVRTYTLIIHHHSLPRLSRAPPAAFPTHIV